MVFISPRLVEAMTELKRRRSRPARVLIISVNYRSRGAVLEMLSCLQRLKQSQDVDIVVADNASDAEELAEIRTAIRGFSHAKLLESPTNRGYFGAARLAFDHYMRGRQGLPEWVIVCNPDIVIEDVDFLLRLFTLNSLAEGVIAPQIRVIPGLWDQNPFMRHRPSRLRWAELELVSSNYALARAWGWLSRQKSEVRSWVTRYVHPSSNGKREPIYAPHGSFFIFARRYFQAGGFLDGNLFLYCEEISVAEICRSLLLPVVYEPLLRVLHREHQCVGRAVNRFTYECHKNAVKYITSRYFAGSPINLPEPPLAGT